MIIHDELRSPMQGRLKVPRNISKHATRLVPMDWKPRERMPKRW